MRNKARCNMVAGRKIEGLERKGGRTSPIEGRSHLRGGGNVMVAPGGGG